MKGVGTRGYTWGLTPTELVRILPWSILVIFPHRYLGCSTSILVANRGPIPETATGAPPASDAQDAGYWAGMWAPWMPPKKPWALLYEALVYPFGSAAKDFGITSSGVLWLLDLFNYPCFWRNVSFVGNYAGLFPFDYKLGPFWKVRSLAYNFFKHLMQGLYAVLPFSW